MTSSVTNKGKQAERRGRAKTALRHVARPHPSHGTRLTNKTHTDQVACLAFASPGTRRVPFGGHTASDLGSASLAPRIGLCLRQPTSHRHLHQR